jgi:hypothetical protein
MAVYSLPAEFANDVPVYVFGKSLADYNKVEAEWVAKFKAWALERNPDQDGVGEELQFPVADGYARYIVLSIKPIQLVHLPLGDGYHSPGVNRLTARGVREHIASRKRMAMFFAEKRAERGANNS